MHRPMRNLHVQVQQQTPTDSAPKRLPRVITAVADRDF